ncbi:MAG: 1-deoxy-D-xylulose-5-phosphate reductoisomerase [Rhodothermales bacterium]
MQRISILGSTGSIGTQTLDVLRLFPERFKVDALTAGSNVELLIEQAREFVPECVVIADASRREELTSGLQDTAVRVLVGRDGLCEAATLPDVDTVVASLVGFAGLESVIEAVRAGKKVALANKETLVVAGELVMGLVANHDSVLLPVDSEHSAIFQCLVGEPSDSIEELILTASGGPFRTRPADTFTSITREEALDHPNWSMGAKITIDSATMMNKGLEVIEARWLFGIEAAHISVLVHPQSIIHSLVVFRDGSTKAQLGVPDMKVPIQYALSYPERWAAPHERVDWSDVRRLDFETPDHAKFPCLELAFEALRMGGTAPAILNAANEEAVGLFLDERIRFVDIPDVVGEALAKIPPVASPRLEDLVASDEEARRVALEHARARTI